jgi:diguanylate cyclase (GGDEF)-like protein/PAS domain S-box-containing protein
MPIKSGQSTEREQGIALREVIEQIRQPDIAFILLFCSVRFDLDAIARGIAEVFPRIPVLGCTTAGELGHMGHSAGGLVAASFPAEEFTIASAVLTDAQTRDGDAMRAILADAKARMGVFPQRFALLFADGLSGMEEIISQACQSEFGDIPVVGGSAGDDERYAETLVLHDGSFRRGETVIAAISTTRAAKPFQTHPFFSSGTPLVITDADPRRRVILEINGHPASREYARALGLEPADLGPEQFANAPLIARINGVDFARAIRSANPDGSLSLYCAIDRGLVLRIGRKADLYHNRKTIISTLREALGEVTFVLGFECLLNKRDFLDDLAMDGIDRLYREGRVFGFTTYGEQYRGLHMNQTFTGVAFGAVIADAAEYRNLKYRGDLEGEIERRDRVIDALIAHNDSMNELADSSFAVFHRTAYLETEVNTRTTALNGAIAELESVNKALAQNKAKFQAIFDLLPTPALVSRLKDGVLLDVNASFCEILGYKKEAIIGKRSDSPEMRLWLAEGDRERFIARLEDSGGVLQGLEIKLRDATGGEKPYIISARILSRDEERILIVEFLDVGDYARRLNVLRDLSERDSLTGLPNRLLILDRLDQATRLLRRNGQGMAVAYLDLDGFKDVNDRYGHKAGDLVLAETAARLQARVRDSDTVGRMGGDEFIVLLLEPENEAACEATFRRIIAAMSEPFPLPDASVCRISVSLGYTMFPEDASPPSGLLEHADRALYEAKRAGKNRFARYAKDP